jgi:hypothetical protein
MFVPPGVRVRAITIFLAVAIMMLVLVYVAVSRGYRASPNIPATHTQR